MGFSLLFKKIVIVKLFVLFEFEKFRKIMYLKFLIICYFVFLGS